MALYKYLSSKRIGVIANLRIRFSQPSALNDPIDCIPAVAKPDDMEKWVEGIVRRNFLKILAAGMPSAAIEDAKNKLMAHYETEFSHHLQFCAEVIKRSIDKEIGVLSLSEVKDHPVLWAFYAENHAGFVIEFNETDGFFHKTPQDLEGEGELRKVRYSAERAVVKIDEIKFRNEYLFLKSEHWRHEREIRMVRRLIQADEIHDDKCLFVLPPTAIKAIIFGMNAAPAFISEMVKIVRSNPLLSHVTFEQAVMDEGYYNMVFNEMQL